MPRKKGKVEFRYYEVPHGEPLLALLGEAWIRPYGYDENDRLITDLHFHNLMEIGICYDGRGEIILEDKSYPYAAGTITVIPKNYPHTTNSENRKMSQWEYLFLDMEKTVQMFFPDNRWYAEQFQERLSRRAFCTTAEQHPELAGLIRKILAEMTQRTEFYQEAAYGLLRTLFVELLRYDLNQEKENLKGKEQVRSKKVEQLQIARALEYVGDYYEYPLRVSDLAGVCHMSETHFRRLFVRCMGIHPADYINQVRIKMVCERLRKTNEPISDAAAKCGFGSLATFNRNFRKFTGVAPNEWKKRPEAYEYRLQTQKIEMHEGW